MHHRHLLSLFLLAPFSSPAVAAPGDFDVYDITSADHFELTASSLNCRAAPSATAPILFTLQRNDWIRGWYRGEDVPMVGHVDAEGKSWVRHYISENDERPGGLTCWARASSNYMRRVESYGKVLRCETSRHIVEIQATPASGAGHAAEFHYYAWDKANPSSAPSLYLSRFVDANNPMPHATHTRLLEFRNGDFSYTVSTWFPYAADPLESQHVGQSLYVMQGDTMLLDEPCNNVN